MIINNWWFLPQNTVSTLVQQVHIFWRHLSCKFYRFNSFWCHTSPCLKRNCHLLLCFLLYVHNMWRNKPALICHVQTSFFLRGWKGGGFHLNIKLWGSESYEAMVRGRSHNSVFMISGVKAGVLVYTYGFMYLHLFKQKIIIVMLEPDVGLVELQ